ncbi:hypothetical protein J2S09_001436 [Bacillus fengqiuensis]|nr:hypothetical protein [Bacillus fengqiuensis]
MKRLSSQQKVQQYTYLFYKMGIITEQQKNEIIKTHN